MMCVHRRQSRYFSPISTKPGERIKVFARAFLSVCLVWPKKARTHVLRCEELLLLIIAHLCISIIHICVERRWFTMSLPLLLAVVPSSCLELTPHRHCIISFPLLVFFSAFSSCLSSSSQSWNAVSDARTSMARTTVINFHLGKKLD